MNQSNFIQYPAPLLFGVFMALSAPQQQWDPGSVGSPGVGVTKPIFSVPVIFHIFRYCQNKG